MAGEKLTIPQPDAAVIEKYLEHEINFRNGVGVAKRAFLLKQDYIFDPVVVPIEGTPWDADHPILKYLEVCDRDIVPWGRARVTPDGLGYEYECWKVTLHYSTDRAGLRSRPRVRYSTCTETVNNLLGRKWAKKNAEGVITPILDGNGNEEFIDPETLPQSITYNVTEINVDWISETYPMAAQDCQGKLNNAEIYIKDEAGNQLPDTWPFPLTGAEQLLLARVDAEPTFMVWQGVAKWVYMISYTFKHLDHSHNEVWRCAPIKWDAANGGPLRNPTTGKFIFDNTNPSGWYYSDPPIHGTADFSLLFPETWVVR